MKDNPTFRLKLLINVICSGSRHPKWHLNWFSKIVYNFSSKTANTWLFIFVMSREQFLGTTALAENFQYCSNTWLDKGSSLWKIQHIVSFLPIWMQTFKSLDTCFLTLWVQHVSQRINIYFLCKVFTAKQTRYVQVNK